MISITGGVNRIIASVRGFELTRANELERRIAELEEYVGQLEADWSGEEVLRLRDALTVERKRREECEAVLREVANAPNRIAHNSRIIAAYFGEGN